LASPLDMNREEREQYVIKLYKEGRTIRDIAGLVHMSFRDIGALANYSGKVMDMRRLKAYIKLV
jgi:hypothetical protein